MEDNEDSDKFDFLLNDDMTFPKATIDPKLEKLQKLVIEFVTSVILKHECEFYILISKNFPEKIEEILGITNPSIISMITVVTEKFYNDLYFAIQCKSDFPPTKLIIEMDDLTDYGPHILMDKLMRLTYEAHIDVLREELVIDNLDLYTKSVLQQINLYLQSKNIIHIMAKGPDDDTPFTNFKDGNKPFKITIEKNIQ